MRERRRQSLHSRYVTTFKHDERLLGRQVLVTIMVAVTLTRLGLCLRARFLAGPHQIHATVQWHGAVLPHSRRFMCCCIVTVNPFDSNLAQVVEAQCSPWGDGRGRASHFST